MPTGFLTSHQRSQFATFPDSLSQDELTKAFTLDDADMRAIASLRTSRNRLGFAVLLTSIRFIGVFPARADEIPQSVIDYLSAQLHITGPISLVGYFASKTCERHVGVCRRYV